MNNTNGLKKVSKKSQRQQIVKNAIIYGAVLLFALLAALSLLTRQANGNEVPLSEAIADIRDGKVSELRVEEHKVVLLYKDGGRKLTYKEPMQGVSEILSDWKVDLNLVKVSVQDPALNSFWSMIVNNLFFILPAIFILIFLMRQAKDAGSTMFAFGKSRARLFTKDSPKMKFADVAGVDEAKKELEEVVEFLKFPEKFRALGARIPKGVLLVGPAGVGKTLLARAVAGEASVPFFSLAGSEFMEMFVGVGASRVRDLFSTAKKAAPSIIFIDEIESIGRARAIGGFSGGHDEREQTLNQILVEMDGFTPNDNVIVTGATNRPDLLDPALVRPGRFDRRVVLDMPDIEGRKAILEIHKKGKPFEEHIDWERVARRTVGFSGADLENMLNEAAILAARQDKKTIAFDDIEEAATKVKMGPKKKRVQSEEEKKMTAYHESGHALVAHLLPNMDPVHRVSIVSRGLSLGHTMLPPTHDRYNETQSHLENIVTSLLGGRAAEELVFRDFTVGASSDLEQANTIARRMVTEYGMSKLGPIASAFLEDADKAIWFQRNTISENLASKVDGEIKRIVDEAYARAKKILQANRKKLDRVAAVLISKETLEGDEFETLVGKQ